MPAVTDSAAAPSQEFPGWTLWLSGTGRLWASWRAELSAAEQAAGCVPFLHADTHEALASQIRAQEALQPPADIRRVNQLGQSAS
jgi:hypothetical protein